MRSALKETPMAPGVLVIAVEPDRAKMISEMVQSMKGVADVEIISPLYWKKTWPVGPEGVEATIIPVILSGRGRNPALAIVAN